MTALREVIAYAKMAINQSIDWQGLAEEFPQVQWATLLIRVWPTPEAMKRRQAGLGAWGLQFDVGQAQFQIVDDPEVSPDTVVAHVNESAAWAGLAGAKPLDLWCQGQLDLEFNWGGPTLHFEVFNRLWDRIQQAVLARSE